MYLILKIYSQNTSPESAQVRGSEDHKHTHTHVCIACTKAQGLRWCRLWMVLHHTVVSRYAKIWMMPCWLPTWSSLLILVSLCVCGLFPSSCRIQSDYCLTSQRLLVGIYMSKGTGCDGVQVNWRRLTTDRTNMPIQQCTTCIHCPTGLATRPQVHRTHVHSLPGVYRKIYYYREYSRKWCNAYTHVQIH